MPVACARESLGLWKVMQWSITHTACHCCKEGNEYQPAVSSLGRTPEMFSGADSFFALSVSQQLQGLAHVSEILNRLCQEVKKVLHRNMPDSCSEWPDISPGTDQLCSSGVFRLRVSCNPVKDCSTCFPWWSLRCWSFIGFGPWGTSDSWIRLDMQHLHLL